MSGMFDATCECGKRIGWAGELGDRPPCPSCGRRPDPAKLAEDQAMLDGFRAKLREREALEWEQRTPEQHAAWEAGRTAYTDTLEISSGVDRPSPMDALRVNPYTPRAIKKRGADGGMGKWWNRGWHNAENEELNRGR